MLALVRNGSISVYPYTVTDLRRANPNTGLPNFPDDAALEAFGVFRVSPSTPLAYNERTQVLVEDAPVFNTDDQRWTQVWSVRDITADELQAKLDKKSGAIRTARNAKLVASDWTQLADSPVDVAAWATYRQELRDITAQVDFPWDVTWPIAP
jgi:hypothetical protein